MHGLDLCASHAAPAVLQAQAAIASTAMRFLEKSIVPMTFTLWFKK